MESLFVGIDVSSLNNVVYLMKPNGDKHSLFTVPNNKQGGKTIILKILAALHELNLSHSTIGLESTSIYGDALVYALRENAMLAKFEIKVHVLNPKQVKRFKSIYTELPKNDSVDAFIIADNLRFGRITQEVYLDDFRYKALQLLTRARFAAIRNLAKEKQRFSNYVFLKCCSLKQEPFIDTQSTTFKAIMENYESADEIAYASLDDLASFIDKASRSHYDNSKDVATAIKRAATASYHLPQTVNQSVNQAIAVSLSTMRSLEKQIKILDKSIENQFEIIPNTLTSIPGIGKVYSAGIIAELGNINRFESQAAVAKYAGLSWTQYQSGTYESESTKLIHSGNRFLKYYFVEAANSVRRRDPEFNRYYNLKVAEVIKNKHKRALVLTARKLVRLIFRLLKDNRLYIAPEN